MSAKSAIKCPECEKIAREVSATVVHLLRAADKAARQQADRRRMAVLKARRDHELRTGHRVPA